MISSSYTTYRMSVIFGLEHQKSTQIMSIFLWRTGQNKCQVCYRELKYNMIWIKYDTNTPTRRLEMTCVCIGYTFDTHLIHIWYTYKTATLWYGIDLLLHKHTKIGG